jgi:hypothetical protein
MRLATLLFLCLGTVAYGQTKIELELTDGSRLWAEPVENLRLRTKVGEVAIPLASITGFEVADVVTVHWADGDRLSGTAQKSLELRTVLGLLQVPMATIASARVTTVAAIKPESIQVSGHWADHQKPEMAIDGELGRAWSSGDWRGWIELDLGAVRELGRVEFALQFDPTGPATHEVYVADQPIGNNREKARLVERLSGVRENHAKLAVDCPNVSARYVQVHCPQSASWFNIRELNVWPTRSHD